MSRRTKMTLSTFASRLEKRSFAVSQPTYTFPGSSTLVSLTISPDSSSRYFSTKPSPWKTPCSLQLRCCRTSSCVPTHWLISKGSSLPLLLPTKVPCCLIHIAKQHTINSTRLTQKPSRRSSTLYQEQMTCSRIGSVPKIVRRCILRS